MNIKFNNISYGNDLICFTGIPNILKIKDAADGTTTRYTMNINADFSSQTTSDNQWYITMMGDTITNVIDPENAISKSFYVSDVASTAVSIMRALRNCPSVSASFSITFNGTSSVILEGKDIGDIPLNIETNIPSEYVGGIIRRGSASSILFGGKVDVDILSNGNYITTLEKNYYGDSVSFNLSPVLSSLASYGKTAPFTLDVYTIRQNGVYETIGSVGENYISEGYMVNQGAKFLPFSQETIVAQNMSRGTNKTQLNRDNNSVLYVYGDSIPCSAYKKELGIAEIDVGYYDSAFNQLGGYDYNDIERTDSNNYIVDFNVPILRQYYPDAFYVMVVFIDSNMNPVYRAVYNVIKPLKATEYYQRICWRNSYGGISFFDFTGAKQESRDIDNQTYQQNIYNYYTEDSNVTDRVYDNNVNYSTTLKSHLIEEDGKWIFNDLAGAKEVWTEINGEKYNIIIDTVSVDETSSNNVYEATVKYHLSQNPSNL